MVPSEWDKHLFLSWGHQLESIFRGTGSGGISIPYVTCTQFCSFSFYFLNGLVLTRLLTHLCRVNRALNISMHVLVVLMSVFSGRREQSKLLNVKFCTPFVWIKEKLLSCEASTISIRTEEAMAPSRTPIRRPAWQRNRRGKSPLVSRHVTSGPSLSTHLWRNTSTF